MERSVNNLPIVKCSQCRKILPFEKFSEHECKLELVGTKTIPVINFLETSCKGMKIMTGWGTDGILYAFKVVSRKPIPITMPLADEKKHLRRTDEDVPAPQKGFC